MILILYVTIITRKRAMTKLLLRIYIILLSATFMFTIIFINGD